MSDETRTPNVKTVRSVFVRAHPFSASTSYEDRRAEFDRFIAKVKADALREADSALGDLDNQWPDHLYPAVRGWLKARADRIEGEA